MSVLETPRILFRGNMSWDPVTTNNYEQLYDEDTDQTIYPPDVQPPTIQAKVAAFREEAIADVSPEAPGAVQRSWNPHGSYRSLFFDETFPDSASPNSSIVESCVSGFDVGQGLSCEDPFVGVPARFAGMLVDLEPYGAYTSQLFFDAMTFGIDGGCRIAATRRFRANGRYVNLNRNPVFYIAGFASVIWQTSFLKEDLVIDAFDSAALQALLSAMDDADVLGLTVRWNTYRTVYYDTPELATDPDLADTRARELMAKLQGGGFQPNPARSKMIGVIGLWRHGEPIGEPGDRALLTTSTSPPTQAAVATAFARLGESSVTIDLGNSIPETGLDLVKQDLGGLDVVAVDPDSGQVVATLGALSYADYDQQAYEAGSGIVTLAVDPAEAAKAANANLQLRQSQDSSVLLDEAPLRAIPFEQNMYLDQDEVVPAVWHVYDRGALAAPGIGVTFWTLDTNGNPLGSFERQTSTEGQTGFALHFTEGGITAYAPLFGADPPAPAGGINTQLNTYMYARCRPADADLAGLPPTWDNVYTNVLANWNAMAPCMDNWLDLADQERVKAYGPMIKNMTDPAGFESYWFMPVTRDMSYGQRALLYNFLDGIAPAPKMARSAPLEGVEGGAAAPELVRASKSMRGG